MSSTEPPAGDPFTRALAPLLAEALEVAEAQVLPHLRPAADLAHGDYALP